MAPEATDPQATVNALDADSSEAAGEWSCVSKKKGRTKHVGELKAQSPCSSSGGAAEPPVSGRSVALCKQQPDLTASKKCAAGGGYAMGGLVNPPWRRAQAETSPPSPKLVEGSAQIEEQPPAPATDRWAALDRTVGRLERTPTPPPSSRIIGGSTPIKQRSPLAPPWLKPKQRSNSDQSDQAARTLDHPGSSPSAEVVGGSSSIKDRSLPHPSTDRWAALDPAVRWPESDTSYQRPKNKYSPKHVPAASPKFKPATSPQLQPADGPNVPLSDGNLDNPRRARDDVNDEIVWVLDQAKCMLKRSDFNTRSIQLLHAIHQKGGRSKVHEALDLVFALTTTKSRETIQNWAGYVSKLLKKFFDDLNEEVQEQRRASLENLEHASEMPQSEKLGASMGARSPLSTIGVPSSLTLQC